MVASFQFSNDDALAGRVNGTGRRPGVVRNRDPSPMRSDDRSADRKTDPHPVLLRREKALEDTIEIFVRDPRSAVAVEKPTASSSRAGLEVDPPHRPVDLRNGMDTVHERLTITCCNWMRSPTIGSAAPSFADSLTDLELDLVANERQGLFNDFAEIDGDQLGLVPVSRHPAERLDDIAGTACLPNRIGA